MAADLTPSVNGMYGSQYGQPVELAASVPSSNQALAASQAPAEPDTGTKADPQEIGWYFVEQYYTTLSKHPDRIHLFYSKKSQLVTGIEAEKVLPSVGQKAINEKIKELDIQNCKVRVLNVDSQTSLNNIVVQVIGVMSNKSAPSKKFVQTFVLTPQTNGYYVLNDIFRYLNDEEDEIIEDEAAPEPVVAEEESAPPPPTADVEQESVNNEAGADELDAKLEEVVDTEVAAEVNGDSTESAVEEPVPKETSPEISEEVLVPVPSENPPEPEHTPAPSPPKASTPAPAAEVPPSKKTWANLVGSKATAVPAVPVSTPNFPSQPKAQKSPPTAPSQQSSSANEQDITSVPQGNEWQTADHGKKQARPQNKAASEGNVLGYIKNVTEKIEASKLRGALEKYGEMKYFDVYRPRSCAFVEFATPSGYNAAVAANPHQIGSEQIYLEERRPRPNAFGGSNSGFSRGGANAGRGRGGNYPKEAGRGNYHGKTGSITPKGRGQAQPV